MPEKKVITVVCEKDFEEHARFFIGLVESQIPTLGKDGKKVEREPDFAISALLWNKKMLDDNQIKTSSSQKMLFIGLETDEIIKKYKLITPIQFEKYDVKYGRNGQTILLYMSYWLKLFKPQWRSTIAKKYKNMREEFFTMAPNQEISSIEMMKNEYFKTLPTADELITGLKFCVKSYMHFLLIRSAMRDLNLMIARQALIYGLLRFYLYDFMDFMKN